MENLTFFDTFSCYKILGLKSMLKTLVLKKILVLKILVWKCRPVLYW